MIVTAKEIKYFFYYIKNTNTELIVTVNLMGNKQIKRSKLLIEFSKRQYVEKSTIDLLFKNEKIDVNIVDFNGYTPLTYAAFSGNNYIVKKLIEREDIKINLQNSYGNTPLIVSCYSNNEYIVKKFINNKNIDVNTQNIHGDTALISSVLHDNLNIIQSLLYLKKLNINIQNEYGNTALLCAVSSNCINKLKVIAETISCFHKGNQNTKYLKPRDGISLGEVGFPTLLYHNNLRFTVLNRNIYFVNEWN